MPSFRFDHHELVPESRRLVRDGADVVVGLRVFDLIAALIEHRDRVVGRDELISAIWGRTEAGDALLAQNDFDGAIAQFTERLALEPNTDARLDLARAWAKKRVAKQAEPLFREVLKAEPDNRDARNLQAKPSFARITQRFSRKQSRVVIKHWL